MKYQGSKARIAKDILPLILKNRLSTQWYVEPFAGGCNIIDKVQGNRIGNDSNEYLIAFWKALITGWEPPKSLSYEEYIDIRNNKCKYPKELVCFAGICCSFAGKWFGGYARGYNSKGYARNYAYEQYQHIQKQKINLTEVVFYCGNYDEFLIPDNSIIYCDPPYRNTTKYKDTINYDHFYSWCREKHKNGHKIFVYEYNMPSDFSCIWEKEQVSSLDLNTGGKRAVEKLFTFGVI